jgi:alpha-ribazole phosphatase
MFSSHDLLQKMCMYTPALLGKERGSGYKNLNAWIFYMTTIIDLIRHGQPEGGARYRGHGIDDPLSPQGWEEMWATVGTHAPWHYIITSPLRRCREFAQVLAQRHNLNHRIETDLREIGFGAWEGLNKNEIKQKFGATAYQDFNRDPLHFRPSGAEDLHAFIDRTCTTYHRLCQEFNGQHILLVVHAGVIRAVLCHILQAPPASLYRIDSDTGAISRISYDNDDVTVRLKFHNRKSI